MPSTLLAVRPLSTDFVSAATQPSFGVRAGHRFIEFDASVDQDCFWTEVMPLHYASQGFTVTIRWMATTATSGNVVWAVNIERHDVGGLDLDGSSFTTQKTATSAAQAATGQLSEATITFSNAEIDGVLAGEEFRLRLRRIGTDVSDTMTSGAQLTTAYLQQTGTGLAASGTGFFQDGAGLNATIGEGASPPSASGDHSLAQGNAVVIGATGDNSFGLGDTLSIDGSRSLVLGTGHTLTSNRTLLIGQDHTPTGGDSASIGYDIQAAEYSLGVGDNISMGKASIGVGKDITIATDAEYSLAVGQTISIGAGNEGSTAIGYSLTLTGSEYSFAAGGYITITAGSSGEVFAQGEDILLYGDHNFAQGDDIEMLGAGNAYNFAQGDTIQFNATAHYSFGQGFDIAIGNGSNVHDQVFAQGANIVVGATQGTDNVLAQGIELVVEANRAVALGAFVTVARDDQATLGSNRALQSSAQWSNIRKHIQTTNNTQTTVITLDLEEDKTYALRGIVAGRRTDTDGDDAGFSLVQGIAFRNTGGVAVLAGTPKAFSKETAAGATNWSVDIASSGNNLLLRVTGDTGHTIEWCAVLEFLEVLG